MPQISSWLSIKGPELGLASYYSYEHRRTGRQKTDREQEKDRISCKMSSPSVDLTLQLPPYPDRFELAAKFAGAPLHEKLTQVCMSHSFSTNRQGGKQNDTSDDVGLSEDDYR